MCGINTYKDKREASKLFDGWLREFSEQMPDCTYVDVAAYEPLHRTDIYVEDNVHFNQIGYDIYGEFLKEVLKDELARF